MYRLSFLRRCSTASNISISQILKDKPLGQCSVDGWVRNSRKQKDRSFIDLSDGSSAQHLQIVVSRKILPDNAKHHSAIRIVGELQKSSHPKQELELVAERVEVLNSCSEPYPFQPKKQFSMNFVRQYPGYKAKTNSTAALLRIRSHLHQSINQYFQKNGFLHIHTPILTSNDCEDGGEVFKISAKPQGVKPNYNQMYAEGAQQSINQSTEEIPGDPLEIFNPLVNSIPEDLKVKLKKKEEYFDKPVYLTVSGQLHLEALCNGIKKVYSINPAFRAEKGRTRRHLSEFWMVEAEIAFVDDIKVLLDVIEDLVRYTTKSLLESKLEDLETFSKSATVPDRLDFLRSILNTEFHRISFKEACGIIKEHTNLPRVEADLSRDHELFLCEHLGGPVFVYNWPKSSKPFYMRETKEDDSLVSCVDLLVPGVGELCGGSLRETSVQSLEKRINDDGLDWYIDLRRKGSAPTAGFGLGFERLIQWLVGVENIKDTIPFYRSSHDCQL